MAERRRRRAKPNRRKIAPAPPDVDLEEVATRVRYIGSPEHKSGPSFAGGLKGRRPDASICPNSLNWSQDTMTQWLQLAIIAGHFGAEWEAGFPRYVWYRDGETLYEGRHSGNGEYHGYPLESGETVMGLNEPN